MKRKELGIGRSDLNDIVIKDPSVSKFHAKMIFEADGTLWIQDLNSSNGTFVNNVKISGKKQLFVEDQVRLANALFYWQGELLTEEKTDYKSVEEPEVANEKVIEARQRSGFKKMLPLIIAAASVILILSAVFYFGMDRGLTIAENPDWKKKKRENEYSVECLNDSSLIGEAIKTGGAIKKEAIKNVEVPIADEIKVGNEVKAQIDRQYRYSNNDQLKSRISNICNKLLSKMKKKRMDYEWYILESEEINAFTAGGKIFITTGIINFSRADDELACVIGHEIYHNELGHINDKLKEHKLAKDLLGEGLGYIAVAAGSVLGASFNQENEAYCDLYGLDLAVEAGYNGCAATELWDRMSEKETNDGDLMKIFRSHPYSEDRSKCIHHHINHNYAKSCLTE